MIQHTGWVSDARAGARMLRRQCGSERPKKEEAPALEAAATREDTALNLSRCERAPLASVLSAEAGNDPAQRLTACVVIRIVYFVESGFVEPTGF